MKVTIDRYGVELEPVCHEPAGAECRITCPQGCESWSLPHEHEMEELDYCNAVAFLTEDDLGECYAGEEAPLHDGMPIAIEWTGVGYEWKIAGTKKESNSE
jgi:hypothetical protein